jgi:hypothetical protein
LPSASFSLGGRFMMLVFRRLISASSILFAATCFAETAPAQVGQPQPGVTTREAGKANLPSPNLTLVRTRMSIGNDALALNHPAVATAFPQMNISCPASAKTCTLRIEVSSQFYRVDANSSARMHVRVDGTEANIFPNPQVGVSTNPSDHAVVATMTFVKNVAPGPHTVLVRFSTSSGAASAGYRTLTASMFTP